MPAHPWLAHPLKEKFLPATNIAAALAYVVLANQDHVKLHLLGSSVAHTASPFYRGRRRITDCIRFDTSLSPEGPLELAPALAEHLEECARPGKAILISDFLMPAPSYQQGLNLLRAFNLDIAVIQVLTRQEVDPPFANGSLRLVDSETNAEIGFQWDARSPARLSNQTGAS